MDNLQIKSYQGIYEVVMTDQVFNLLETMPTETTQFIVDELVFNLYQSQFQKHLPNRKFTLVTALENNKNIDAISKIVEPLMKNQVKIDHTLIAIGGGIIQDITCFLASTLFRGMKWVFVPTTLLAQADSCIGSKSSINVGPFKNLMGTFLPPQKILLDTSFQKTLSKDEILSGIGEILKVHMVHGKPFFDQILSEYNSLLNDEACLKKYILKALEYKKILIEKDEFDRNVRNVMNYGHSYGHAIEAATNFSIPHGIAVSIGMDMANHQSYKMGRIDLDSFSRWHTVIRKNYSEFINVNIPLDIFLNAISKDKKNTGNDLALILVQNNGEIEKVKVKNNEEFVKNCTDFFINFFSKT